MYLYISLINSPIFINHTINKIDHIISMKTIQKKINIDAKFLRHCEKVYDFLF
jgi:hypothetical protein